MVEIDKKTRNSILLRAEKMHEHEPAYKKVGRIELIFVFLSAAILALSLHMFIFQTVRVDGPSMLPNFYTDERVLAEKLSYNFEFPHRGDVVICIYDTSFFGKEVVIKRVIGLPGETIEVTDGKVLINSQPIDESRYWHDRINQDMEPIVVPDRNIFVIGDNRNVSRDSRDPMVGPVPYDRIIGRAAFVIWPISSFGPVPNVR